MRWVVMYNTGVKQATGCAFMDHTEMVELIRAGVGGPGGTWADFGAGTGNFTWALAALLGPTATIYALDRDGKAIARQRELLAQVARPLAAIVPQQADITQRITLPLLDGVLMANVLHFVRDQPGALALAVSYLRPGGRLLLVEYDLAAPLRYVPYPVPFERFAALALQVGCHSPVRVGQRVSPSSGIVMYAAQARR